MAIDRPEAIDDASACGPERSGGWRQGGFLASRGMTAEPAGEESRPAAVAARRSRRQPSFGQIRPSRGTWAACRTQQPGDRAKAYRQLTVRLHPTGDQPRPTGRTRHHRESGIGNAVAYPASLAGRRSRFRPARSTGADVRVERAPAFQARLRPVPAKDDTFVPRCPGAPEQARGVRPSARPVPPGAGRRRRGDRG